MLEKRESTISENVKFQGSVYGILSQKSISLTKVFIDKVIKFNRFWLL